MDEKNKCEKCNKEFVSLEALNQHKLVKHPENIKKEALPLNKRKIRNWAIFIIIVLGFMVLVYYGISGIIKEDKNCQNIPVTEMNIGSHKNLRNHIHQNLEIIIDGVEREIPSNIGISQGIMRPIHTHDSTGEIHVEGPCVRAFTLGEFFEIWKKEFNSTKIFDKTTENGTLKMTVNGQENNEFGNLILKDDDEIVIEYTSS